MTRSLTLRASWRNGGGAGPTGGGFRENLETEGGMRKERREEEKKDKE